MMHFSRSRGTTWILQNLLQSFLCSLFILLTSVKNGLHFSEGILKYCNTSSMIHRAKELLPKTKEELIREIKENHFVRCGEVAQNHVQYSRLFFLSNIFLPSGTI